MVSAIRHALAAVLPSRWPDPCPTTVLEAMALGSPLVTTPVGGITDMVDDASALLAAPGDAPDLRRAMREMIASADLRRRLAAAASERVGRFTLGVVVPQIEEIYRDVVAEKAAHQ